MPGSYPISFSTEALTAANYAFTYVKGTLAVLPGVPQSNSPYPQLRDSVGPTESVRISVAATASSGLPVRLTP